MQVSPAGSYLSTECGITVQWMGLSAPTPFASGPSTSAPHGAVRYESPIEPTTQLRKDFIIPGGYHPVSLGDTSKKNRYRVVHKLGWGGFSTVWLARDTLLGAWVALKIEIADKTIPSLELLNLQSIHQHTGSVRVACLIDSFAQEGPNGSHQCTVTELLGPSVDSVVTDNHTGGERLESDIILKITKQLLEAICSLHQAGYAPEVSAMPCLEN